MSTNYTLEKPTTKTELLTVAKTSAAGGGVMGSANANAAPFAVVLPSELERGATKSGNHPGGILTHA